MRKKTNMCRLFLPSEAALVARDEACVYRGSEGVDDGDFLHQMHIYLPLPPWVEVEPIGRGLSTPTPSPIAPFPSCSKERFVCVCVFFFAYAHILLNLGNTIGVGEHADKKKKDPGFVESIATRVRERVIVTP